MIGNKLLSIIKEKKITQKELANLLNRPAPTINRWIKNIHNPSTDDLKKLAHTLNIPVSYFLEDIDISNKDIKNVIKVPVIGEVPAGQPIEAVEDFIDELYVPEKLCVSGEFFGLSIKGNSMYPTLHNGEYVLVIKNADIQNEDIVIARLNSEHDVTCKRIIKVNHENYILRPDNPQFETIIVSEEKYPEFRVLGKVVYAARKIKK